MTTFVLIHAAATDSSCWRPVTAALQRRGHDAVAVDLPVDDDSAGLADYADTVLDAVTEHRDVVVVGHSFGGFTAPLVAHRLPADLLVMLQAQIPLPGEAPGEWWGNTGHAEARRQRDEADGRDPDALLDPLEIMLHDTPAELAEEMLAHQRDQSATPFGTAWPLTAWPDLPTRVLVTEGDRFFPLGFMRRITRERLGIEPDVMPGDHCPMLGHPEELADRLVAYRDQLR